MIEQVISAYRLPHQAVRDFLLSIFGEQGIHIQVRDDWYRMLIPRALSEAEVEELNDRRGKGSLYVEDNSDGTTTPPHQSRVAAPGAEVIPLMGPSAEGSFKLPVESANVDNTGLQYSLFDEQLHVDYSRGALGSLYTINVSGGLTCKVFEVYARWSWFSTRGSKSRGAKVFKVAVKRLKKETTPEEFSKEYKSLRAITKGHHRNIVDFLNAFRYEEGGNVYYNFAFPLAAGNLKQLFRFSSTKTVDASQHVGPGTPPVQFPANFVSMASKTLWSEFEGLAGAVAYLHDECQIVHSDIEPSNILLYECAQSPPFVVAKLTDFGLAVDFKAELTRGKSRSSPLYQETTYADSKSEELKSGDVWKLGSVFVELLSFLIKGEAGVHAFREFITTAQRDLTSDEISDTRFDDGVKVKDKVLDWIVHLSQLDFRARSTGPILRAMLGPGSERPSSALVTQSLRICGISPCFDGLRQVYITPARFIRTPPAIDRCKERIESWIGQQIDWWPLDSGERSCPQGYNRISWEWNTRTLCIDVPELIAQAYKDSCRILAEIPQSSLEPSDPANPSAVGHEEAVSYGVPPQRRSARDRRSQMQPPIYAGSQSQPRPSPASTIPTNSTLAPDPGRRDVEIYWCVDKAWSEPRITKLCSLQKAKQILDDKSLCERLIKDYNKIRTWKGRLLSWKSCLGVDFIQFHRPYPGQDEVVKLKVGLPPCDPSIWEYTRKSEEEVHMGMAEKHIIDGIHRPWLASGHKIALDMIPKKVSNHPQGGPNVHPMTETESWGMHARQGFSLWKIMAWILILDYPWSCLCRSLAHFRQQD